MEHGEQEAGQEQEQEAPAVITCSGGVTLPSLGVPAQDEADGAE